MEETNGTTNVSQETENKIDPVKDVENILGDDEALENDDDSQEIVEIEPEEENDAPEVEDYEGGIFDDEGNYIPDEENDDTEKTASEDTQMSEEPSEEMKQNIIQTVADRLDVSEVPNTKEFRAAVIKQAKAEVCKELDVEEYDNFDEEHQALFMEKFDEIRKQRKEKFDNTVKEVTDSYEQQNRIENVKNKLLKVCDTNEKLQELEKALGGASYNTVEAMKAEIAKGKSDLLMKFVNNLFEKKAAIKNHTGSRPKQNHNKSTAKKRDRGFASDIVFGGY